MAKKMSISFKEKELYMYNYLQTKVNAAVYIKELILKDMEEKNINKTRLDQKITIQRNNNNLMDFEV